MTAREYPGDATELVYPLDVRADGLPMLPGGNDQQIAVLRRLLEQLRGGRELTAELAWPNDQERTTVRDAVRRLGRIGLVRRESDRVVPTAAALAWCAGGDDGLLVEIFHRHVAFIGELMAALADADEPVGLEALLMLGRAEYGFQWKTVTPVRQRTNWLRATGMINYFEGGARLTKRGRELTARLVLPGPRATPPSEEARLAPASVEVSMLLQELTMSDRRMRSAGASLYVLGSQANGGRLRILRALTESALPVISRHAFADLCARLVGRAVPPKSVARVLETVTTLGLLQRVAEDAWEPTPAARAWLDSGDPLDLAGIIHAHVAYFGELLSHLADGTASTTAELARLSRAYLDGGVLRVASVNARLQLLAACGLAEKRTATTYQATPGGRVFLAALPLASAVAHDDGGEQQSVAAEEGAVATSTVCIAQELESAARDSAHPERLEHAVIAALDALGLPGRHIGGSRHTDGAVQLGIGSQRRTVAVEAKTAAAGSVPSQRVDFEGLSEHREKLGADVTLLIGTQFHDRVHKSASKDQSVAVLHTGFLAELVRGNEATPLDMDQLDILVDPRLDANTREEMISSRRQEQLRRIDVECAVVTTLLEEAEHSSEGGWMTQRELERYLRRLELPDSGALISQCLDLLRHPRIAAVERRHDEFRLVADRQTIGNRMRALSFSW
ncbi:hypothetical protein AB0C96_27110 [Streptomyces sp. NPDC048506]|uniref:hypothetical protein n=1 Tax=Streptomyces sp. NPDC048506 TaxID=3155028 RepID=UPI003448AEB4